MIITERSFPNPKLSCGKAMTYKRYRDSFEYIGLKDKQLTEEVIGLGHVVKESDKSIPTLNTTQLLLAELQFDLAKIPKSHTVRRATLQVQIDAILSRH